MCLGCLNPIYVFEIIDKNTETLGETLETPVPLVWQKPFKYKDLIGMGDDQSGVTGDDDGAEMDVQGHADGAAGNDQLSLLPDEDQLGWEDDEDDSDRVFSGGGRGRGRPRGSLNRKTETLQRYYQARNFKDPISFLGDLVSANPLELLAWLKKHNPAGEHNLLDVIKLQKSAAVDVAPYLHGKMPVSLDIKDDRLPMLIMDLGTNQLDEARKGQEAGVLSAGSRIDEDE